MRRAIGLELVGDARRCTVQISDITERTEHALADCGSTLTTIFGCGPVTAGRIIARTGNPFRFQSESAFATYTGTAPVQVASADTSRHRLSRDGDRTLNSAIHIIAVCQSINANSPGYTYLHSKMDAGMTRRSAMRCLKRQVAKKLWRTMCDDHRRWQALQQLESLAM